MGSVEGGAVELRLLLIEPRALRRRIVRETAAAVPGLTMVGEEASARDVAKISAAGPDLLIISAELIPWQIEYLRSICARVPEAQVLLLGPTADVGTLIAALDLNLAGTLSLEQVLDGSLATSLDFIAAGGAVLEPLLARQLLEYLRDLAGNRPEFPADVDDVLTQREHDVLRLLRSGLANKEIALQLRVREGTVRAHLRSIFRKLRVSSRAGAVWASAPLVDEGRRHAPPVA